VNGNGQNSEHKRELVLSLFTGAGLLDMGFDPIAAQPIEKFSPLR
jgi:hypothetical protein